MADTAIRGIDAPVVRRRMTVRKIARRKSTVAFLMALPLITLISVLVVYPAL